MNARDAWKLRNFGLVGFRRTPDPSALLTGNAGAPEGQDLITLGYVWRQIRAIVADRKRGICASYPMHCAACGALSSTFALCDSFTTRAL